jgi:rhamnulokinase
MSPPHFLAIDLGAESGRLILGSLQQHHLHLEEVHRFENRPVRVGNNLYWDVLRLWTEIQHGLALACRQAGESLVSLGVDTWGVDFGLLAAGNELLGNPVHYRDRRTDGMLEQAYRVISPEEIYRQTGIQFMQINTLYQLLAMSRAGSPLLAAARTFLNMPDLFNFWLSGEKASEFTIATTTQCYNPLDGDWAHPILARLGIPGQIFGQIVSPGTVLGKLRPTLAADINCAPVRVIAAAGHDTACAVAAVPAASPDYIYLSSGTWSLMGIESPQPIINQESLAFNLTNEGGVNGTFRVLKNIMGMWLLQECRREWALQGQGFSYAELTQMAAQAPPLQSFVRTSDSRFLHPGDAQLGTMVSRIQAFCQETGQPVPRSIGEITRCILESLVLEYRRTVEQLDAITAKELPVIHIIGGGSRNQLLNQMTADATRRVVVSGPVEATATGNILLQAIATGHLASLAEARSLVRLSGEVATWEPAGASGWDGAYASYLTWTE